MNLPPVTDQEDNDPTCRFCLRTATLYNEYRAAWKNISDFNEGATQ